MLAAEEMAHSMPSKAMPAVALIITYSALSLICGLIFVFHVCQMENRFLYISLFAYASTAMTAIAIVQEVLCMVNWYQIAVQTYEMAQRSAEHRYLAFGPQGYGAELVLYWIQVFLCYCIALIVAFWAIGLTINSWGWRFERLYVHRCLISLISKVSAFVLPAITVILRATTYVESSIGVMIFLDYMLLFLPVCVIMICVVLIMIKSVCTSLRKYRQKRHRQSESRGGRQSLTIVRTPSATKEPVRCPTAGASLVDSWMVRRFSVACLIISAYIAYLAYYSSRSYLTTLNLASQPGPDFSTNATVTAYVKFIPLVTLSFLGFLLFGTTSLAIGHYKAAAQSLIRRLGWRVNQAELTGHSRERGSLTVRAISIDMVTEKGTGPPLVTDWTAIV